MHGQEKLGEAVSAGQLIIQLSNSLLAQDCSYHHHRSRPHVPPLPLSITISLKWFFIKNKQRNKETNKNMTFDHNS